MRILHIIGTLDPAAGGPTEAVRVLLTHGPEDYSSEVLTLDDPAAPFLRELPFPVHALGPQASTYGFTRRLPPWLRANRDRFDGVLLHGLWQYTNHAAWRALRARIPYMVFPHGMLDPYFKQAFPAKHLKKWPYWHLVEYRVLRDAHRVLFTCEAEQQLAKQSFARHRWAPHVVPFGTVPPPPNEETQREAFFTQHPALRDKRFLLFLGRIHPKKGCDLLLNAFAKQAARDPGLHLVMAGPDPQNWRAQLEQPAIAANITHRIHWPGMLRGDAKWGAFRACEAFILPSHQENFGIAVAEALACAKPVLLSDKVNTAPDIAVAQAGLMEPDTPEGAERLLTRWIAMTEAERQAMSTKALACFLQRYDMRESAKTIVRLFETS